LQGDHTTFDLSQLRSTNFGTVKSFQRHETELRQTTVKGLLATLKTWSNLTTGAGSSTFVATAASLTQTATDATAWT
jgi:hypothetical protein